MILVNNKPIKIDSYPDGTILMKPGISIDSLAHIEWYYDHDREFLALIYLVKHLRHIGFPKITLYMPYIPNARMDRQKGIDDVFTLKYFAEVLNDLRLDSVTVFDPHSNVSEALIDNLRVVRPNSTVEEVISYMTAVKCEPFKPLMFYPDEGAMKRYSDLVCRPYVFGIKRRNWETGEIEGLDVAGATDLIAGKDILIVDDICSRGGTFLHSARKLKELGAKDIYLYVTHCENTILEGDLLEGDLIKQVFTTKSIFTKEHEKIIVL